MAVPLTYVNPSVPSSGRQVVSGMSGSAALCESCGYQGVSGVLDDVQNLLSGVPTWVLIVVVAAVAFVLFRLLFGRRRGAAPGRLLTLAF